MRPVDFAVRPRAGRHTAPPGIATQGDVVVLRSLDTRRLVDDSADAPAPAGRDASRAAEVSEDRSPTGSTGCPGRR